MRQISIRQFQQHFHKELKNLPFVVTRRKKIAFVVTFNKENVVTSKKPKNLTGGFCKHGAKEGLCKFGC